MVILSDGADNQSRWNVRAVRNLLLESDVQVFAVGIFDEGLDKLTEEERRGPSLLEELAEDSGGKMYNARNLGELPVIAAEIGRDLRDQYMLGYRPNNQNLDGKYHRIRVTLNSPTAQPKMNLDHRRGYYAPKN